MAEPEDPTEVQGTSKHVIEFELLDDDTKRRVLECIERKGRISVVIHEASVRSIAGGGDSGYKQIID